MSLAYLRDQPWSAWTREERYFCGVLYQHASRNTPDFAQWLISTAGLNSVEPDGSWDLGWEVCLARDVAWHRGESAKANSWSAKRTFDLCLFGERNIIIIEAKVCEIFKGQQHASFEGDAEMIAQIPGFSQLRVVHVALASSRYLLAARSEKRRNALKVFGQQTVSWQDAFQKYGDHRLSQADRLYGSKPGEVLGA